jgi:hypothetical protein
VVDHLKKEKNKMAKFDYQKWVTENKYGINEQYSGINCYTCVTGSIGSIEPGLITEPATQIYVGYGTYDSSYAAENFPYGGCYSETTGPYYLIGNTTQSAVMPCDYGVEPFADNEWDPNLSGCGNFNNLPGNIQQLACQAYFNLGDTNNPSLTMWVQGGSCCSTGSMDTGSMAPTGSFAGGGMTTGSMAQGMPSMMKKRPPRRKPVKKMPTKGLKEVKNKIKKLIKKIQVPTKGKMPIGENNLLEELKINLKKKK